MKKKYLLDWNYTTQSSVCLNESSELFSFTPRPYPQSNFSPSRLTSRMNLFLFNKSNIS